MSETEVISTAGSGGNLLTNEDFSTGSTDPYFNNVPDSMSWVDGTLCVQLPPGAETFQPIVESVPRFDLVFGSYVIEYDHKSSHAGKRILSTMWQQSTNTQPLYEDVAPTTVGWDRKQAIYTNNSQETLTLVNLTIVALEDPTDTVEYCIDNYTFYKLHLLQMFG